jgi:hypothetical protein
MIDCANNGEDADVHDAESPPISSRLSVNLHDLANHLQAAKIRQYHTTQATATAITHATSLILRR